DDEDAVPRVERRAADDLLDAPDLADLDVARIVGLVVVRGPWRCEAHTADRDHLDVGVSPRGDAVALAATATRRIVRDAVERLCELRCSERLADVIRPGEEVGVCHAPVADG